jgi:hypothetical protein
MPIQSNTHRWLGVERNGPAKHIHLEEMEWATVDEVQGLAHEQ